MKQFLSFAFIYDFFQWAAGANNLRQWYTHKLLKADKGATLYEAGCGTGSILNLIPEVKDYFGYDISPSYIAQAKERFPNYHFHVIEGDDLSVMPSFPCDIFFCVGLLHHLTDEQVTAVMKLAKQNLKQRGRFVALEPCYLRHQSKLSHWLMSKDRGEYIRHPEQYAELISEHFKDVKLDVVTNLTNIPYIHLAIEANN
ncbi:class I SAM-dependent methyltransferase [Rubellicoccus peritrichatus]|uniref:Methyltransferase domain-containing protein n=1 Tax=Rubellicoccus peritrichatus TaxID=3080537 RepID=A0AAQ3LE38_9BACT|nr:methyltransferase [Puniceicoccus sp. CR14]WOO42952.1 methyltransferase domain-containing protein [Puniceicoccus sp. CR14]